MQDASRALERLNGFRVYGFHLSVSITKYQGRNPYWRKVRYRKDYSKELLTDIKRGQPSSCTWDKCKEDTSEHRELADGECGKHRRNFFRRIQGHVEDETLWRLNKCLLGTMATVCSSVSVMERLHSWGLGEIEVKSLGGRRLPERSTWVEVMGVPLHYWNHITFKRIAEVWGSIVALGENANQTLGCEKLSLLISTNQMHKINEVIELEVGKELFEVSVSETVLLDATSSKQKVGEVNKADLKVRSSVVVSSSSTADSGRS
ncbi:hypothetical protein V6N13_129492 [Hibiscus sabdariffa]